MARLRMEKIHPSLITDGVEEHEQTLSVLKPFWVFFAGNMGIATWLMGLLVAGMNLSYTDSIFTLFFGSAVGAALLGALAVMGPKLRLSQMEMGRYSLGKNGKRIPAILTWCSAVGWDAINNIFSAAAFVSLFSYFNIAVPLWATLGVLVFIEMMVSVYGHHVIQDTAKYSGVILGIFFILIGFVALHSATAPSFVVVKSDFKTIFGAFALLVFFNVSGWGAYMSDYTRYLPGCLKKRIVFTSLFSSVLSSTLILALFGYMTAVLVTDPSPEGIMKSLTSITGHYAPLVLFFIGISAIPPNAMNDNTAAYSLISVGFKLPRHTAAIFSAIVGYIICLAASDDFVSFFENFLSLFTHWIAPWGAILLVHFFVVGKKEEKTKSGIAPGCVIFLVTTVLSVLLFSANSLYTGLLSDAVGGNDIGPFIGFAVAGAAYYAWLKLKPARN